MFSATEVRHDPPTVIKLRPVPRCEPPFDDELPSDAAVSAGQLTFPWPRTSRWTPAGALGQAARDAGQADTPGASGATRLGGATAHSGPDGAGAAGLAVRSGCDSDAGTAGDARLAVRRFVSVCVE